MTSGWSRVPWLVARFDQLYGISLTKDATVVDLGEWRDVNWVWKFAWRRGLFVWEENLLLSTLDLLKTCRLFEDTQDGCWMGNAMSPITVKYAYQLFTATSQPRNVVYKLLWDRSIPLKVGAFCWTVILDKIPTYSNLN